MAPQKPTKQDLDQTQEAPVNETTAEPTAEVPAPSNEVDQLRERIKQLEAENMAHTRDKKILEDSLQVSLEKLDNLARAGKINFEPKRVVPAGPGGQFILRDY